MKNLLTIAFILGLSAANGQSITKLWQTDTTLATPESVLYTDKALYVSLIDGAGWDADGKGGIGILDHNGKIVNANWVTGLSAPKGMAIVKGVLYVADITEIVS